MLYLARKRGLPRKFARFVPFCPIKKRSLYSLVCFGSFLYTPCLDTLALPCLALLDCVQSCCTVMFHVFSPDHFHGSITYKTGRLSHTTLRGGGSVNVIGQENCD